MNLEEITALEEEWLGKQGRLKYEWLKTQPKKRPNPGSLEETHRMCEETGIYQAWRIIFREYVGLARTGDLEALKRAIFMVWYEWTEPNWLSGIDGLEEGLVEEVLHTVNAMAKEGRLDSELQWMLPWYYKITEYYLWRADGLDDLKKASQGDPYAYWEGCPKSSFDHRGQLGRYWGGHQKALSLDWGDMGVHL